MMLTDLSHKRKTVSDLIRFIGNTTEYLESPERVNTPNYSILLGAGASVTSGIRSGQTLIDEWKKEIYEESDKKDDISLENFFNSNNAPDWYEENNAYSALFENRYDLQRHRRMFVEHEVAGKTPSIGYAYLVKLIEKGFFNTVFTTNFDDLLNEAFYRFSKERPIVCAHDSSISGITVTSTRPKIIKLHGDYLFDDIKTTLRETESLEVNMRMKFQEFAKDFGLIVVGYSGHDRSIMDILTYLLQHEDYFKNGIYWCIRKGDKNISSELKKLLWRDRVFFVEIDGFDELFAEINHKLNNGNLPIDDAFLSRAHQETIIKELTENTNLNLTSNSTYLAEDCRKLRDHFENNLANDFLKYIRDKNSEQTKADNNKRARRKLPFPELNIDEKRELNDLINEAFGLGHVKSVIQKLQNKDIFTFEDSRYKLELLQLSADLTKNMSDELVKKYFDELIRLDPDNERYYEIAANRSSEIKQSLDYLAQAVNKFNNDHYIINAYISRLLDYCEDTPVLSEREIELKKIEENIKRSIELFPYIDNFAYTYKVRYIKLYYNNDVEKKKTYFEDICKEVIGLSKYHPQTLCVLRTTNSDTLTEKLLKEALEFYQKADNDNYIENAYIELIKWYDNQQKIDNILNCFKDYEEKYNFSDNYKFVKANILMKYEYLEDAYELYRSIPNNRDAIERSMTVLSYLEKKDKIIEIYNGLTNKENYEEHFYNVMREYDKLIPLYSQKQADNSLTKSELISYAYSLLKLGKYPEVMTLLKPYYDNPVLVDGAIIVNYLFAKAKHEKQSDAKIKIKLKEKIIESKYNNYSNFEKLGASCVIGNINDIVSYLGKILKEDPISKYTIKEWPIMLPHLKDQKVNKLLAPAIKKIENRS